MISRKYATFLHLIFLIFLKVHGPCLVQPRGTVIAKVAFQSQNPSRAGNASKTEEAAFCSSFLDFIWKMPSQALISVLNRLVPLPNLSDEDGVTVLATNKLTLAVLSNRALVSAPTQVLFGEKVVVASTGALSVLAPPY